MQHWVKWVFDNFEEVPSSNNFSASYRRCFVNPPQKDIWKTSVMEFFSVKLPTANYLTGTFRTFILKKALKGYLCRLENEAQCIF